MRAVRILGILISLVVAAASVWWVRKAEDKGQTAKTEVAKTLSLVVAAEPLRYGQKITKSQLKLIDWMGTSLPAGSFETIASVNADDNGPYALAAIAEGAPILKSQITVAGQKPSLSARLSQDEVAVTIPVNTITGVAGFVLPEERVDVLLNRKRNDRRFADIILQNVRVLAVNSIPDAGAGDPVQAKSVTFAAKREDAQKLVVATGMGEISLVLRSPMNETSGPVRSISDLELVDDEEGTSKPLPPLPEPTPEAQAAVVPVQTAGKADLAAAPPPPPPKPVVQITVIRGLDSHVVTIP